MTKIWVLVFLTGLRTGDSFGQVITCDSVYVIADQMPFYGKGHDDTFNLVKNIKVSKPCKPEEIRRLTWTINKEGKMVDIEVIGPEENCKAAIIEQLKTFPAWTPGKLNGEVVCIKMIFPIHIRPID